MRQVTLTERAAEHVRRFLGKQAGAGLRLKVKTTGCSGYSYVVEMADAPADNDEVFESRGIKLMVDRASLPFLVGTEVDFAREGLNAGFRFQNPNAKATCGCGESFNV
ncbi:MAG: HesB/IscA family protein [Gammaproteobacteria bacterium]